MPRKERLLPECEQLLREEEELDEAWVQKELANRREERGECFKERFALERAQNRAEVDKLYHPGTNEPAQTKTMSISELVAYRKREEQAKTDAEV